MPGFLLISQVIVSREGSTKSTIIHQLATLMMLRLRLITCEKDSETCEPAVWLCDIWLHLFGWKWSRVIFVNCPSIFLNLNVNYSPIPQGLVRSLIPLKFRRTERISRKAFDPIEIYPDTAFDNRAKESFLMSQVQKEIPPPSVY